MAKGSVTTSGINMSKGAVKITSGFTGRKVSAAFSTPVEKNKYPPLYRSAVGQALSK